MGKVKEQLFLDHEDYSDDDYLDDEYWYNEYLENLKKRRSNLSF
jgi:hypothetical protein